MILLAEIRKWSQRNAEFDVECKSLPVVFQICKWVEISWVVGLFESQFVFRLFLVLHKNTSVDLGMGLSKNSWWTGTLERIYFSKN